MRIRIRLRISNTGRYDTCDRIELDVGGSSHLRPVARPKGRGGSSAKAGACRKTMGLAQTVRSDGHPNELNACPVKHNHSFGTVPNRQQLPQKYCYRAW
jgi:hypothetical protein